MTEDAFVASGAHDRCAAFRRRASRRASVARTAPVGRPRARAGDRCREFVFVVVARAAAAAADVRGGRRARGAVDRPGGPRGGRLFFF